MLFMLHASTAFKGGDAYMGELDTPLETKNRLNDRLIKILLFSSILLHENVFIDLLSIA